MSATMLLSPKSKPMNPDEDFVLHGHATPYWEKSGFYGKSSLTNTTARLSQHALYDPDNYRDRKGMTYAKTLSDLANNLEYVSEKVDHTLHTLCKRSPTDDVKTNEKLEETATSKPMLTKASLHESLRTDITDDELLRLYEEKIEDIDNMGGKPISPRGSQWYVNPNHLSSTIEAPTLQSVGHTFRKGEKVKDNYSDKDKIALSYFPVTLGSAYDLCAEEFPEAKPMLSSAPPSMRSRSVKPRSRSATRLRNSHTVRISDKFDENQDLEKLYLTTAEAPTIGSSNVFIMSPYQKSLGKLRLERLQLEETKLLELKRITELERIRGPKPKWYESKGPDFHYEAHKNTEFIKCESQYQDLLDYREDLLRSSYHSLRKYTRAMN